MKKIFAFVFAIMILGVGFASAADSATDSLTVKANVLAEEISLSVPDEIIFQDIAPGYLSEKQSLEVSNTGTVDISVSAALDESYVDDVFTNLGFRKVLSDDLTNIRYFDFDVMKPAVVGGERTEGIYMYLDLVDYAGAIAEADHSAEVIFTAVPL